MANSLQLQQLGFERNNQFLFRDITIHLNAGDCLQVRGANGSGKSTLLRILAGLIEPHEGSIIAHGIPQLQYIGHQSGIKLGLTVLENLELYAAMQLQKNNVTHLQPILKKLELSLLTEKLAALLSAGQLRRLSLARLLLHPVPLWILDEPTTALDIAGQQLLSTLLKEHSDSGGITIIATHHPFDGGKILELGEHCA